MAERDEMSEGEEIYFRERWEAGDTLETIAEAMEVSVNMVKTRAKRLGLQGRGQPEIRKPPRHKAENKMAHIARGGMR